MREPTPSPSPLDWRAAASSGVHLVTLWDAGGLLCRAVRGGAGDAVVVALHRRAADGEPQALYATIGPDGVRETLVENVPGTTPELCAGPDGTPWVRMVLLLDGSDQEPDTVLPLRGRGDWPEPPRTTAFAGEFVGWVGDRAFWHVDDVFDTDKPSRVQAVDLDHGPKGPRLRFRRPVRLPLPQSADAVVCVDGTHPAVLAVDADPDGPAWLRILAPDTLSVVRETPVTRDADEAHLVLAEAHSDGSALLYGVAADGRVDAIHLAADGTRTTTPAGRLPGEPFSVWPIRAPGRHALRFRTEDAGGLLVPGSTDGGAPAALWIGTEDACHFRDTIGGREVRLADADWGRPTVVGAVANAEGHVLVLAPEDDPHRLALLFV
ncbi:hypothetical protein [Embleya sp. AB8]|uniref:hypothetical protein n=1 Tax=Embleya sp. AB8 TaxID=3156304 RepID=UPI003C74D9C7